MALVGADQPAAARTSALEAVACARQRGTRLHEPIALVALARTLLVADGSKDADEIRSVVTQGFSVVEDIGAQLFAPHFHEALADLAKIEGQNEARARELQVAHQLFSEMGATGHAARLSK